MKNDLIWLGIGGITLLFLLLGGTWLKATWPNYGLPVGVIWLGGYLVGRIAHIYDRDDDSLPLLDNNKKV